MDVKKIMLEIGKTKFILERIEKGIIRTKVKGHQEVQYSFGHCPCVNTAVTQLATGLFLSLVGPKPRNPRQPNVSRSDFKGLVKIIKEIAGLN